MSSEGKSLVNAATVKVIGDASGDESSSSSTYGTVLQDSIVMCPVPSDSSDTEIANDNPNRRLVSRPPDSSGHDTAAVRSTT